MDYFNGLNSTTNLTPFTEHSQKVNMQVDELSNTGEEAHLVKETAPLFVKKTSAQDLK